MARRKRKKNHPYLIFYNEHQHHILGILLMVFSVLLMIALITFWIPPNSVWANLGGPIGHNIALGLFQLSGFTAFLIPVLLFLWGEHSYEQRNVKPLLVLTTKLFSVVYPGFLLIGYVSGSRAAVFAGIPGVRIQQWLVHTVGQIATFFILAGGLIVLMERFGFISLRPNVIKRQLARVLSRIYYQWHTFRRRQLAREMEIPPFRKALNPAQPTETEPPPDKAPVPPPMEAEAMIVDAEPVIDDLDDIVIVADRRERSPRSFKIPDQSPTYRYPDFDMLDDAPPKHAKIDKSEVMASAERIEESLGHYNVTGKITEVHPGPIITRYEFKPSPGIKVSKIMSLADDLALVMSAKRVRILAPVPGKPVVGIEVPNRVSEIVYLKEILRSKAFEKVDSALPIALGKDTAGFSMATDLAKMPHLLVAGATGSGKSVCINTIITSILYRSSPDVVRFLMIDPKMLELSIYNGIPHLQRPVVTDRKEAVKILKWAVWEMERRYRILAKVGVRNIKHFNKLIEQKKDPLVSLDLLTVDLQKPLPYIVIIIDELADLMMTVANEIEELLARLAQMARAIGIHLILATQRPSVDVITGLIKANFPSRIAFQSSSKVDSRTILDRNGAEKLLGNGDMLFLPSTAPEPIRIHGSFISSEETHRIVRFLAEQAGNEIVNSYDPLLEEYEEHMAQEDELLDSEGDLDDLFEEAKMIVISQQQASVSLLQRRLRIGYARAGRLIDQLHDAGIVGPFEGSKSRQVLLKTFEAPPRASDFDD